jgi:hypothetical protein
VTGDRCILSVKYVSAGSAKGLSGFLRYVQFRDQHADLKRELGGLTRYIAHRDRTALGGRLFGPRGNAGDLDRRALLAHISRSLRDGHGKYPRAAYRFVLSPERAEGLDLKALTRAAIDELGREVGGTPPWIAAIHRNTKHPHVHIVMAARREVEPGRFKTVVINRERLARMKGALSRELVRERGGTPSRIALLELAPTDRPGRQRSGSRVAGRRFGLVGGLAQFVESRLRALAAQQHRELRRWQAEEERREREREAQRRKERDLQFER